MNPNLYYFSGGVLNIMSVRSFAKNGTASIDITWLDGTVTTYADSAHDLFNRLSNHSN